jgi:hypothetical protein
VTPLAGALAAVTLVMAAQAPAPVPEPAIDGVIKALQSHQLAAITDPHGWRLEEPLTKLFPGASSWPAPAVAAVSGTTLGALDAGQLMPAVARCGASRSRASRSSKQKAFKSYAAPRSDG